jgi:5'-nucleotidase
MKILVTNDDGIAAPGLWVLVKELCTVGEVKVIAPRTEQAGLGTGVTLGHPIKVNRAKSDLSGVEVYAVEGTPADCVIVGIKSLFPGEIGLVVSGINRGANIGYDAFISGTVGAAFHGYLRNIPSLAVSLNAYENLNFEAPAKLVALLAAKIKDEDLSKEILLNITLPNLPPEKIMGVEITELSEQSYCDVVERDQDCEEECYRILRNNKDILYASRGTDIWALQLDRVSITPLLNNPGANSLKARLQGLLPAIYDSLRNF